MGKRGRGLSFARPKKAEAGKSKGFGRGPKPLQYAQTSRLLQRAVDRVELAAEGRTQRVHRGNDREGDAGGEQRVFNRGGARLVLRETSKKGLHFGNSIDLRVAVVCRPE